MQVKQTEIPDEMGVSTMEECKSAILQCTWRLVQCLQSN